MKKDRFGSVALGIGAVAMTGLGMVGLLAPGKILDPLGISMSGAAAFNEIRATYGGAHLALAAIFALGALRPDLRKAALLLQSITCAAILSSRLISILIDGAPNPVVLKAVVVECVLLLTAGLALARRPAAAVSPGVASA